MDAKVTRAIELQEDADNLAFLARKILEQDDNQIGAEYFQYLSMQQYAEARLLLGITE